MNPNVLKSYLRNLILLTLLSIALAVLHGFFDAVPITTMLYPVAALQLVQRRALNTPLSIDDSNHSLHFNFRLMSTGMILLVCLINVLQQTVLSTSLAVICGTVLLWLEFSWTPTPPHDPSTHLSPH